MDWAKAHGYATGKEANLNGAAGGAAIGMGKRKVKSVSLGGIAAKDVQPLLFDMKAIRERLGIACTGIIGQAFMQKYLLTIDYSAETMTMQPQSDRKTFVATAKRQGVVAVPFTMGMGLKMVVVGQIGDYPEGVYILDTGAMKSGIFKGAYDKMGDATRTWPRVDGLKAISMFGTDETFAVRVPSFSVGGARVDNVVFGVPGGGLEKMLENMAKPKVCGLVGYTYLKYFILTIDYGKSTLYLLKNPHYRDKYPNEDTNVGFECIDRDGKKMAYSVITGGPAAVAGIREGDELVSIDGIPADKLSMMQIADRMDGAEGSTIKLVLRRGGVEKEYTLTRKKML